MKDAYIRSPLIPGILAKVKEVDGYEPLEQLFIERYKFTYEEAAIWARNQANIWATLEADFVRSGESRGLKYRIQLLFIVPDVQIGWEKMKVEVTDPEFLDYIDEVRKMPLSESVKSYQQSIRAPEK